jgi:predicted restriction endonuclease
VLENFGDSCALTGLRHRALLNASHIVGWAKAPAHRLDPRNGIALNRLHDAAFDRKLITFDEQLRLVVGRRLRDVLGRDTLSEAFLAYEGKALRKHERWRISEDLLRQHRVAYAHMNR